MNRRQVLVTIGAVSPPALAGCLEQAGLTASSTAGADDFDIPNDPEELPVDDGDKGTDLWEFTMEDYEVIEIGDENGDGSHSVWIANQEEVRSFYVAVFDTEEDEFILEEQYEPPVLERVIIDINIPSLYVVVVQFDDGSETHKLRIPRRYFDRSGNTRIAVYPSEILSTVVMLE